MLKPSIRQLTAPLISFLMLIPSLASAETYLNLSSTIFTNAGNGGGFACTECHSSGNTITDISDTVTYPNGRATVGYRHLAPVGADFDMYHDSTQSDCDLNDDLITDVDGTACRVVTMITYVDPANGFCGANDAYMPMNPFVDADYVCNDGIVTDKYDLSSGEINSIVQWEADGTPYDAPDATTNAETPVSQTSVQLNGNINTNTENPLAKAGKDGRYWFRWRTGTSGSDNGCVTTTTDGWNVVDLTTENSTALQFPSGINVSHTIGGLVCGQDYQYRACASNGHGTATGSVEDINISCTDPVITGTASQSTNEDVQKTFNLSRSDDDAGTLTWSVQQQGSLGSYSFDTSTTGSPVTVRYTPDAHANGVDSNGIIRVTNGTTNLFDDITITMTVTAQPDDPVVSVDNTVAYSELDPPTTLDPSIIVSEFDGQSIQGATVEITNYEAGDGEVLACTGSPAGISSCTFSAGTLTLSGTTTTANYEVALEGVTYYNPSANPTVGDRTVTFIVTDSGGAPSAGDSVTVSVSSISTPPSIAGFDAAPAFTEGTPVDLDTSVTITDPDSPVGNELNRAQLTLTTGHAGAEDLLVCPPSLPVNMNCSYVAPLLQISSAVMTSHSISDYETAIEQVQYDNSSDDPSTATRTVTLTVRDSNNTVSTPPESIDITVAPVNDPPSTNVTPPTIADVYTEEVAVTLFNVNSPAISDPDDDSFTYSLGATALAGDTPAGDMTVTASGDVTWTPPRTGNFVDNSATVTVTVSDENDSGAANGVQQTTLMFSVSTSPLDSDSDGVADYSDNCPSDANAGQQDLDNDTQYTAVDASGIPATGDVIGGATDGNGFITGGDACDEDVDGDGISKAFEDSVSYLSDTDAADAALDEDGDGLTNLEEFQAGSDPAVDSVGPSVTRPSNITVNATGYLTRVQVGTATAVDGNDGAVQTVKPALNASPPIDPDTMGCDILADYPEKVPALRPGRHTITWISCDSEGNLGRSTDQIVIVRPLASVNSGQNIGEGQVATVVTTLNGEAPAYPVNINYRVGGFSNPDVDHDADDGTIVITDPDDDGNSPGRVGKLDINIANDGQAEATETVIITLDAADNAAISASRQHTINIVESNVAPSIRIAVTQGGVPMGSVVYINAAGALDGDIVLTANAFDANGDTLTYQWRDDDNDVDIADSGSDTQMLVINNASRMMLQPAVYPLSVEVSDGQLSSTAIIYLVVAQDEPVVSAGVDTDGDGVDDDVEGVGDADADGIPDYLDASTLPDNVVHNQSARLATSTFLETRLGHSIATGTTARAAGRMGAAITSTDIKTFGGAGGGPGNNVDGDFSFIGGIFDFEVSGLGETQRTADVVIPLPLPILPDALYLKYDGSGWSEFETNSFNRVWSAAGEPGVCPTPGSAEYRPGLTPFYYCVQLTIEDGGPNDADATRDFVLRDPGGVAIPRAVDSATDPAASADERLGLFGPVALVVLLPLLMIGLRRRR